MLHYFEFVWLYGWFYILHNIRLMLRPFDLQALSRFWESSEIKYLQKCTMLNCIVTLIFNQNGSVRELEFVLKNSKSHNTWWKLRKLFKVIKRSTSSILSQIGTVDSKGVRYYQYTGISWYACSVVSYRGTTNRTDILRFSW